MFVKESLGGHKIVKSSLISTQRAAPEGSMNTWLRVLICLVVAIIAVTVMVLILHATIGRSSNAIIGPVGPIIVIATWFLTGLKKYIGPRETSRDALAGPAAELRSDQTAGNRADECARILFRSLAGLGSARAGCDRKRGERGSAQANERHVSSPQMI
jgi:hypothetical protein